MATYEDFQKAVEDARKAEAEKPPEIKQPEPTKEGEEK